MRTLLWSVFLAMSSCSHAKLLIDSFYWIQKATTCRTFGILVAGPNSHAVSQRLRTICRLLNDREVWMCPTCEYQYQAPPSTSSIQTELLRHSIQGFSFRFIPRYGSARAASSTRSSSHPVPALITLWKLNFSASTWRLIHGLFLPEHWSNHFRPWRIKLKQLCSI